MLETPEERIKLLKAGFNGKKIEKLYIENNNFKLVRLPQTINLMELDYTGETGVNNKAKHVCG